MISLVRSVDQARLYQKLVGNFELSVSSLYWTNRAPNTSHRIITDFRFYRLRIRNRKKNSFSGSVHTRIAPPPASATRRRVTPSYRTRNCTVIPTADSVKAQASTIRTPARSTGTDATNTEEYSGWCGAALPMQGDEVSLISLVGHASSAEWLCAAGQRFTLLQLDQGCILPAVEKKNVRRRIMRTHI